MGKIKEICRLKGLWIVFGIEVLILIFLGVGLVTPKETFQYDADMLTPLVDQIEFRDNGYYVDETDGVTGNVLESTKMNLKRGVYRVELFYETDSNITNFCDVNSSEQSYHGIITNTVPLYSGKSSTTFLVYLNEQATDFHVIINYGGVGSIVVKTINIYETNIGSRIALFTAFIAFVLLNVIVFGFVYDRKFGISKSSKQVGFGLAIIILFASVPLFADYLISGADTLYHIHRIEGIVGALRAGQFPVRMEPTWIEEYGYASAIFYCETFLYFPAILRMIGFTVQTSYKAYLFMLNVGTALISFYCFKKIFRKNSIGLLASMLYTLSLFRLSNLYSVGAVGQATAFTFYPLILVGFYKLFTDDRKEKGYRFNYLYLLLGYSCMLQSHILSCEMLVLLTLVLCIVFFKLIFHKETMFQLLKTVGCFLLINAWFLVPFLDYMKNGEFLVTNDLRVNNLIQNQGGQFNRMFQIFTGIDETNNPVLITVSAGILLSATIFLYLWFVEKRSKDEKNSVYWIVGKTGTILGAFFLLMASRLFPWDCFQKLNPTLSMLATTLQVPTRLIALVTLCFLTAGMCAVWIIGQYYGSKNRNVVILTVALVCFITSAFYMDKPKDKIRLYIPETSGSYISGAEYLPVGTDASLLVGRMPIVGSPQLTYENYDKKYLHIEMDCKNSSQNEATILLPILYYKGYKAWDENNQLLSIRAGENNCVEVLVPNTEQMHITVDFCSPWYWRLSEAISYVAVIAIAVITIMSARIYKKKSKQQHIQ